VAEINLEVCYVVDTRGKKHLFVDQIVMAKNIGHVWGTAETGEYDDGKRPLFNVASVFFDNERYTMEDIELNRVRISKNKKKVVSSLKKSHMSSPAKETKEGARNNG
jgi:hypothetical protein